jgi:hypothetical protein
MLNAPVEGGSSAVPEPGYFIPVGLFLIAAGWKKFPMIAGR